MDKPFRVHRDVLKLGLVSFLTDVSSEMIFSVFSVVFVSIAGASSALLGVIEGCADLSASSLDYLAGWLSDRTGRRKPLAVAGYVFSTLAKCLPLVAITVPVLAAFRIVERLGKSFRGPPRDAWLASIAGEDSRGMSFGVHKALDKAGAVVGPLVAFALMSARGSTAASVRLLFWAAFIPAILSICVFAFIRDRSAAPRTQAPPRLGWRALQPAFRRYLAVAALFSLGYFSVGFVLLRAHELGFSVASVVLLYALFNASCVLSAPIVGGIGDRIGRAGVLAAGYALYAATNLGFVLATTHAEFIVLLVMYGVFYSIDEAQSKAFIADLEPDSRGAAIGAYNFATGLVYLPASLLAGWLWQSSPPAAFGVAASLGLIAALLMAASRRHWRLETQC